ncbi:MAG: hypothetical protein L7U87_05135, partial [Chlamydiales bacterium]|nr:hypothetical protein [Chlamydiales bacterium]
IILNKTIQTFEGSAQLKKAALQAIANIKIAIACSKKEIQKIQATISGKEERVSGIDRLMESTACKYESLINQQAKQITKGINTALKKHFKSAARKTVFRQQELLHRIASYNSLQELIKELQLKVNEELASIESMWEKMNKSGVTQENLNDFVVLNQSKLELTEISDLLASLLEDTYIISGENSALIVETSNRMFEDIESENGAYLSVLETAKAMSEVDNAKEMFDSKCEALYQESKEIIIEKTKLLDSKTSTLTERIHKLVADLATVIDLEDTPVDHLTSPSP